MKTLQTVAFILLIIGGLNWGFIGLFNLDLVKAIFGSIAGLEKLIYILVGLSALLVAFARKGGK